MDADLTAPHVVRLDDTPDVSFLIASFDAETFLEDAVASAVAQIGVTIEVLIVDDHSRDGSWPLAQRLAAGDGRIRALRTPTNAGPGGARNVAIAAARGRWLAVLDSDDLLDPARSRRLIDAAEAAGADIVADDLFVFPDGAPQQVRRFLGETAGPSNEWIDLDRYFRGTRMFGPTPDLGFLKPMIRADFLARHGLHYDESLRIAEDDALVVSLLRAGGRYLLVPEPLYRYRKHGASISHRLSTDHVDRMMAAGERLRWELASDPAATRALAPRHRALRRAWAFTHLIDALKRRDARRAIGIASAYPTMLPLLRMPAAAVIRRLLRRQSA
jgi:succinoglycan biosynthesis protein ExoO